MKTLTIKRDDIDSLDTDKSKIEFANSIIALLSDSGETSSGKINELLSGGLNSDLPEPMEGAPDFDSSNMSAPEFRRYSLLRAGYVPAGRNGLYCSYSKYEYKHLSKLTKFEFDSLRDSVGFRIKKNKKKKDYVKFLNYLSEICCWFFLNFILPSETRKDIDV